LITVFIRFNSFSLTSLSLNIFNCFPCLLLYGFPISSSFSSVRIATGYGLVSRGSIFGRVKVFSPLHSVQTVSGAHPASYPMGTGASFPGVKGKKVTTHISCRGHGVVLNYLNRGTALPFTFSFFFSFILFVPVAYISLITFPCVVSEVFTSILPGRFHTQSPVCSHNKFLCNIQIYKSRLCVL
jgi:hypothetical protein